MDVAIVTIGEELLAGDIENTNAAWLGRQVTERGGRVGRVLTLPDEPAAIAEAVVRYRQAFDAVIVTGGLGGTHDDVTVAAVADALDREVVVDDETRELVVETAAAYRDANPERVARYELELDPDAWSRRPAGARTVPNDAGLAPGFVVEDVYVFPGPPAELRAIFERVADEFGGDLVAETLYTPMPEEAMKSHLAPVREEFDVVVGSYPVRGDDDNRVKVSGSDPETVAAAADRLRDRLDVSDPP